MKDKKTSWPESDKLPPEQFEINQMLYKLDQHAQLFEAKWGCDMLPQLSGMGEKWQKQIDKLNEAISDNDLYRMRSLCDGTLRGWKIMEDKAIANGYKPCEPDYWEARHESGQVYRIVKNLNEARALYGKVENGVCVWTLQEVINVIHARSNVFEKPKEKKLNLEPDPFDFSKGDTIDF